ncbi:ABC transporter substrate-binding protein [Reinekea sp.]|jgi:iron complex transport system substrate-binding protein|uniref:ABC transporter substrate-binding protein n=1 Tax=Reinekea sp. TaxID=1970455 RepID=UPI003989F4D5
MKKIITLTLISVAVATTATEYPFSFEHQYGTSVIEDQPQRIATIDYAGTDNILALGFQPLTSRYWFGDDPNGIWPWAQPLLTEEPGILLGDLNFEQIASTNPDVIFAIRSGITDKDYQQLSRIAPVIAVPKGYGDYELKWDERARIIGQVLNKEAETEQKISGIKNKISSVAKAHPEWAEHDFSMATYWNGSIGVYSDSDSSVALINQLGLSIAPEVTAISKPGEFYISISAEHLADLDSDVLFWFADAEPLASIRALGVYDLMRAPKEGREIILKTTDRLNGAMSYGTLLSLPEAIDRLVPAIEAAIDGDPTTLANSVEN